MRWIGGTILTFVQLICTIALYWLLAKGLELIVPSYLPGYDALSALSDTQHIMVILLLWDRFWGPYSTLLKGVAKALNKAKKRREE